MAKVTRQEARELLFGLLFETEFHEGDNPKAIYDTACEERQIPVENVYIRETFFGILSKSAVLDAAISNYSKGWRADRLSRVSRSIIRIAAYEMLFVEDIPMNVSISQAVELTVKYGEDKAKQFVNGVLSGMFKDIQARGIDAVIAQSVAAAEAKAAENQVTETAEATEKTENVGETDENA
jgi:N utilization substance protein B